MNGNTYIPDNLTTPTKQVPPGFGYGNSSSPSYNSPQTVGRRSASEFNWAVEQYGANYKHIPPQLLPSNFPPSHFGSLESSPPEISNNYIQTRNVPGEYDASPVRRSHGIPQYHSHQSYAEVRSKEHDPQTSDTYSFSNEDPQESDALKRVTTHRAPRRLLTRKSSQEYGLSSADQSHNTAPSNHDQLYEQQCMAEIKATRAEQELQMLDLRARQRVFDPPTEAEQIAENELRMKLKQEIEYNHSQLRYILDIKAKNHMLYQETTGKEAEANAEQIQEISNGMQNNSRKTRRRHENYRVSKRRSLQYQSKHPEPQNSISKHNEHTRKHVEYIAHHGYDRVNVENSSSVRGSDDASNSTGYLQHRPDSDSNGSKEALSAASRDASPSSVISPKTHADNANAQNSKSHLPANNTQLESPPLGLDDVMKTHESITLYSENSTLGSHTRVFPSKMFSLACQNQLKIKKSKSLNVTDHSPREFTTRGSNVKFQITHSGQAMIDGVLTPPADDHDMVASEFYATPDLSSTTAQELLSCGSDSESDEDDALLTPPKFCSLGSSDATTAFARTLSRTRDGLHYTFLFPNELNQENSLHFPTTPRAPHVIEPAKFSMQTPPGAMYNFSSIDEIYGSDLTPYLSSDLCSSPNFNDFK